MLDLIALVPDHCLSFHICSVKVKLKDMLMYVIFLDNVEPLEDMI